MEKKIPSEGPLLAANVEKARLSGVRQRYALGTVGLPKGDKK